MVRVWSTETGEEISKFQHEELFAINVVSFSPSGRFLAAGTQYGQVFVWDLKVNQLIFLKELHNCGVESLAFSPDEHRLVSAGYGPVIICNWQEDQLDNQSAVSTLGVDYHTNNISRLLFMQKEGLIVTASWDGSVRTWNVRNGITRLVYSKYGDFIHGAYLKPDTSIVYVAVTSAVIAVDIETGETLSEFYSPEEWVTCVTCSADDRWLAFSTRISSGEIGGFESNYIHIYNLHTNTRYFTFSAQKSEISALAFSPDGKYLASGSRNGSVAVWQVETAQELADQYVMKLMTENIEEEDVNFGLQIAVLDDLGGEVSNLCFSTTGHTLAAQTQAVWLLEWRAETKYKYCEGFTSLHNLFAATPLEDVIVIPAYNWLETQVLASDRKVIGWIPTLLNRIEFDLPRRAIAGAFNRFPYFFKLCSPEERRDIVAIAIAELAETVYQQLSESQRRTAKKLFMCLVHPTGDTDSWQSVTWEAFNEEECQVMEIFSGPDCGLLSVTDKDGECLTRTVQVNYPLLIRSWKRLRNWLDEDIDFLNWRRQLAVYLSQWECFNEKKNLLRGETLKQAKEWMYTRSNYLNKHETSFIQLSIEAAKRRLPWRR